MKPNWTSAPPVLVAVAILLTIPGTSDAANPIIQPSETDPFEVGGPLAGMRIPLYPTYHGEQPGKPGDSYGHPQYELYPGSVEHWRAYFLKYCPVRSLFDSQSQLANWTAPDLPGCSSKEVVEYAQPVYRAARHAGGDPTGTFEPSVAVARIEPGHTMLATTLGTLDRGLYCLRVIAAVPTDEETNFRRDLVVTLNVNDQADGGTSRYRMRAAYVDQFYSVVEMYFHAPESRKYHAKLVLDPSSALGCLVRNVSLDDVFAGFVRRPIKKRSNDPMSAPLARAYGQWARTVLSDTEKRKATAEIADTLWRNWPGLNVHFNVMLRPDFQSFKTLREGVSYGANGKTYAELKEEYGPWQCVAPDRGFLVNRKLDLSYSIDDLRAGKPLPDPYPVKDTGLGVSVPDNDGEKGWFYAPVAEGVARRMQDYQKGLTQAREKIAAVEASDDAWCEKLHANLVAFARFVYDYPALDQAQDLGVIVRRTGPYSRQARTRQRLTTPHYLTWYTQYLAHAELYDFFFDVIKDNALLAQDLGRHIPWIKTPADVVELFDTYLVQNTARRVLRYQWYTHAESPARLGAVLGDKDITRPWLEWQFSKAFVYPLPLTGIHYLVTNGSDRSGIEFGTSTYYGLGENATRLVHGMEQYCKAVDEDTFSLLDRAKYPKAFEACYWPLEIMYAGYEHARIGDVTGPEKVAGHCFEQASARALFRRGWEWMQDPRFAAVLVHTDELDGYSRDDRTKLERAAASVERMPYLTNPSRYLPNWCGIIETGKRHDDFRYRRGAMVRTGYAKGHNHNDSLDLQVAAHGILMTLDSGQRPGYCEPPSLTSALHNTVTVNGEERTPAVGWVSALVDSEHLAYQQVHECGRGGARQVLLADVDDDGPARALPIEQQLPRVALPPAGVTPNGYIVDVFREPGGGKLRYNFHAMMNEDFVWNAQDERQNAEVFGGVFKKRPKESFSATAPETLEATWTLRRIATPENKFGVEEHLLGPNFDPDSPPKLLRLHLLDVAGACVERAQAVTMTPAPNNYTCIGTEVDDPNGRVFTAVIEPYVGEPFIESVKFLSIPDNEDDALAAITVEVKTGNGLTDWVFADGRPEKTREIDAVTVSGELAFLSTDAHGLRRAMLSGGTLLESKYVEIRLNRSAYTGAIRSVDYGARTIAVDAVWPDMTWPQLVSIGNEHVTSAYSIIGAENTADGVTALTARRGADLLVTGIRKIDEERQVVEGDLPDPPGLGPLGRTVTNAAQDTFWRSTENHVLLGEVPVSREAFAPENELHVWEYGPGDTATLRAYVLIERTPSGTYTVTGNMAGVISIRDANTDTWVDHVPSLDSAP